MRTSMVTSTLTATPADIASVLPATQYFEIDSEYAGARFGVWVTLPLLYEREDVSYPLIYQTDGNKAVATTAPAFGLLRDDPINPIRPFIQVCVGYVREDAHRMLAVRARDLLPPGEPLGEGIDEGSIQRLPAAGILNESDTRMYLKHLRDPHADRFLDFIVEELDPALRSRFRVSAQDTGLHGYSYGGLFASYAALHTDHFAYVGAGSPGIQRGSAVLDRYDELTGTEPDGAAGGQTGGTAGGEAGGETRGTAGGEAGGETRGTAGGEAGTAGHRTARHLHVTACERELTYPSVYQDVVGYGTTELVARAHRRPIPGLRVTAAFTPSESHATGSAASYFSYLRECYPAEFATDTLARSTP